MRASCLRIRSPRQRTSLCSTLRLSLRLGSENQRAVQKTMTYTGFAIFTATCAVSCLVHAQVTTFSPEGCEFALDFPSGYEVRDVHVEGRTGKLAVSKPFSWGQLSAECWRSEQPASVSKFASQLEEQVGRSGFTTTSVTSRQAKYGPVVLLLASAVVQGKKYNLSLETHFGKTSRMEAKVVQVELMGVQQDELFRKSVRQRSPSTTQ
jgi:hypothetical protein